MRLRSVPPPPQISLDLRGVEIRDDRRNTLGSLFQGIVPNNYPRISEVLRQRPMNACASRNEQHVRSNTVSLVDRVKSLVTSLLAPSVVHAQTTCPTCNRPDDCVGHYMYAIPYQCPQGCFGTYDHFTSNPGPAPQNQGFCYTGGKKCTLDSCDICAEKPCQT